MKTIVQWGRLHGHGLGMDMGQTHYLFSVNGAERPDANATLCGRPYDPDVVSVREGNASCKTCRRMNGDQGPYTGERR